MSATKAAKDGFEFKTQQWITWMSATIMTCVGLTVFMFQQFETRSHAEEKKAEVYKIIDANKADQRDQMKRIENWAARMETKQDDTIKLILGQRGR